MNEPKLLPCPFCGSEPRIANPVAAHWVNCVGRLCTAQPRVSGKTKDDAITRWNTRHTPDAAPKVDDPAEYLKSKGWSPCHNGDRWVHVRLHPQFDCPSLHVAVDMQRRWDRDQAGETKVDAPSEEHQDKYLKSKGWVPRIPDGYFHPSIRGLYSRTQAYEAQQDRDAALDTEVDEQLEKDIELVRKAAAKEPQEVYAGTGFGTIFTDGPVPGSQSAAIARTILHLLKR